MYVVYSSTPSQVHTLFSGKPAISQAFLLCRRRILLGTVGQNDARVWLPLCFNYYHLISVSLRAYVYRFPSEWITGCALR